MSNIVYTRETFITWATADDQYGNLDFDQEREDYLLQKTYEGKTDGDAIVIDTTKTKRKWIDQASAEDYINFITNVAETKYGLNIVSKQIVDPDAV